MMRRAEKEEERGEGGEREKIERHVGLGLGLPKGGVRGRGSRKKEEGFFDDDNTGGRGKVMGDHAVIGGSVRCRCDIHRERGGGEMGR